MNSLDTNLIKVVLDNSFTEKARYKYLPSYIRQYLSHINGSRFKITNGSYSETDIIKNSRLPNRHFLYVGNSKNYYILSYEHGGKGKHQHTLIIETGNKEVKKMLNLITPFHSTLSNLVEILKTQSFKIQTDMEL